MAKYAGPILLAGTICLGACSLAPEYTVPPTPMAAQFKSAGPWTRAQPGDQLDRDGWWKIYGDAQLNDLEQRLLANNTNLRAALAHYQQAQALVAQARSALFPQVSVGAMPQRIRQSDNKPLRSPGSDDYNSATLGVAVDYDLDLWGRVRDSVAASRDQAQAEKADLASAQLSLQIQLANQYVRLRGLDQQTQLLNQTIAALTKALELTQTLHDGGIDSDLAVAQARAQWSAARAQRPQNIAQRALAEHAIAVLVGASASEFSLPPQTTAINLPITPTGLPSTLLQRRPDIAAAERRAAAANANIGVARAAYFPSITLAAQGGLQSSAYAGLLSAPNLFWMIGPQLVQYAFDGGLRRAQLDAAKAAGDEAGALYRGVVLAAFQQVEDNLSLLSELGLALDQQHDAVNAAQRSLDLAMSSYRQGAIGYLDVVQAQTAALEQQSTALKIQTQQLSASVQLVGALGGGWSSQELADITTAPKLVAASSGSQGN